MGKTLSAPPGPLLSVDGNPVFDERWQAQALAIADTLVQNGVFSAGAWAQTLGEALKRSQAEGDSDDQGNYYRCVLSALENLVIENSNVDPTMLGKKLSSLAEDQNDHAESTEPR
tara:strand:+ start:303 stop:647 length:345 start_codon:yes stop_codon:yes gene_type:complete